MAVEPPVVLEPLQPLSYWYQVYQRRLRGGMGPVTVTQAGRRWYLRGSTFYLTFAPLGAPEPRVCVRWSAVMVDGGTSPYLAARRLHTNAGLLADPLDGEQLTIEHQEAQARSLPEALRTICQCSVALLNRRTPKVGHVR